MFTYDTLDWRTAVPASDDERRRIERSYLRFAGVGIEFVVTLVILTLLGMWIDSHLDTSPAFTIAFLLLGFLSATINLVRTVLRTDRPPNEPDKNV